MSKKYPLTFRTIINESDRALIHRWLTKPYVAKWFYGDGLANTLKGIDDFIKEMTDTKYWLSGNAILSFLKGGDKLSPPF